MKIDIETVAEELARNILDDRVFDYEDIKVKIKVYLSLLYKQDSSSKKGMYNKLQSTMDAMRNNKAKYLRNMSRKELECDIFLDKLKDVLSRDEIIDVFVDLEKSRFNTGVIKTERTRRQIEKTYQG